MFIIEFEQNTKVSQKGETYRENWELSGGGQEDGSMKLEVCG